MCFSAFACEWKRTNKQKSEKQITVCPRNCSSLPNSIPIVNKACDGKIQDVLAFIYRLCSTKKHLTFTLSNCGTIKEVMSSNASVFKRHGGWGERLFDAAPVGAPIQSATENRVFREMSPGLYGSPTPTHTHKARDQWWVLINHDNVTSPSTTVSLNLCPARDRVLFESSNVCVHATCVHT